MKKNKIDPQLIKLLDSMKEVPDRGLQAKQAGREIFLAQIKNLKPRPLSQAQGIKKLRDSGRRSWVSRFAAIAAVLLVLLSGLGGTAYAAQTSGPDDLLYGVKTLTEEIQVGLESNPEEKLDLYISFASRRMQEIQAQIKAGEEVSGKALTLLENHTQKMLEQAAKLDEEGFNNALLQIEVNLQKQNQMLAELSKEHQQFGAPDLLTTQERIQERLDLVENGKNEPQGFKEEVKEQKEKSNNPGQNKDQNNGNSIKTGTPPEHDGNNNSGNGSRNK